MKKKTILIDLDGVLNTYDGVFNENIIPGIRYGAKDFLEELSKNYIIKIFSTRGQKIISSWIKLNNLENYIQGITNVKEPAFLIIDDRCITFDGNYQNTINKINNYKVWYKN